MRGVPEAVIICAGLVMLLAGGAMAQEHAAQVDTVFVKRTGDAGFIYDDEHPLWELGPSLYILDRNDGIEGDFGGDVGAGIAATLQFRIYKLQDEVYPLAQLSFGVGMATYVELGLGISLADWIYLRFGHGWYKEFDSGGGHSTRTFGSQNVFMIGLGFRLGGFLVEVNRLDWDNPRLITDYAYGEEYRSAEFIGNGFGIKLGWLF